MKNIFLSFFLLALLVPYSSHLVLAQDEEQRVEIQLTPEYTHVESGDLIFVAIRKNIYPGWHTYWLNPGDSGAPLSIDWTLPEGFEVQDIMWPVPEIIRTGPLASYGYKGSVTLLQPLIIPRELPEGPITLTADIELLVCEEICIPEWSTHELVLNGPQPPQNNEDYINEAYNALPTEIPWLAFYREEGGDFVVEMEALMPAMAQSLADAPGVALMPKEWGLIDNAAGTRIETGERSIAFRQKRGDRPLRALDEVTGLLVYEGPRGVRRAYSFLARPASEEVTATPAVAAAPGSAQGGGAEGGGGNAATLLAQAIVFALLGGIILNLMPCVFPILSLKALKLCKLSGRDLRDARLDSFFYTGGILASFALFAVIILVLREAGVQAGWGFQLQNPGFVLVLSWLLFVIGLNLSGFFEFGSRLAGVGGNLTQGTGRTSSFMTGVLAAIVATPCVAPFMGIAIGFAMTQPAIVVFTVFLFLGLGLALPYIILAVVPKLRSALPAPGPWMETFRQFLSFPMFGAAIWLAWVFTQQGGSAHALIVLTGALMIAFAIWLFKKAPETGARAAALKLAGVVFIALTIALPVYSGLEGGQRPAEAAFVEGKSEWMPFTPARLAELKEGDDALFVNMTADWCITCKVNERVALDINASRTLFARHNVQLIKGDWTNYNDDITEFLASHGRSGVPLYVYYGPRNEETGARPAPEVLPQLLTPGIVRRTIEKGDTS